MPIQTQFPIGLFSAGGGGMPIPANGLVQWLAPESSKWQDTALTTPAVAQGDLVRVWRDQSGHGNDETAPSDTARPPLDIYTHYPQSTVFNIGNQSRYLVSAGIAAMDSDKQTVFVVVLYDTINTALSNRYIHGSAYNTGPTSGKVQMHVIRAQSDKIRAWAYSAANVQITSDIADLTQEFRVLVSRWKADDTITAYDGLVAQTPGTGADGVPSDHLRNVTGSYSGATGTSNFSGHIVEKIVYAGRDLSDDEVTQIINYLTDKHKRAFARQSVKALVSAASPTDWNGRPSLCDLGGGVWAMVYRTASQHQYDATGQVHIRFSTDEGVTWTAADTFTDANPVSGAPFEGDGTNDIDVPVLVVAPNGDLLLLAGEKDAGGAAGTSQWRSTDGGATFGDEGAIAGTVAGLIYMGMEIVTVGTTIYSVGWQNQYHSELWSSPDSGVNWAKVSNITENAQRTDECTLCWLGGTSLLTVLRDTDAAKTYLRRTDDLGATWGPLQDITAQVGVVQRPRLKVFAAEPSRIYLFGRDAIDAATNGTVVYYSDDQGVSWSTRWWASIKPFIDTGYCDVLRRSDGGFYMQTYEGTTAAVNVVEIVFRKTE